MSRSRIFVGLMACASVALAACARPSVPQVQPSAFAHAPIRRYDLVRRGYDPNGFVLNPQWGWSFNQGCQSGDMESDPTTCSWRFTEDRQIAGTGCNTLVMDPDFSDQWSTSMFGITCSDSPLLFTGHVNWGDSYHGAVSYQGWVTWEEYSLSDNDYNFLLETDEQCAPAPGTILGVEMDEREIHNFSTNWFRTLNIKALTKGAEETKDFVGRRQVILTGLLGIDAEHMSARLLNAELHPVYAMAIRVGDPAEVDTDVWALFARDAANEGFCSHQGRNHVLRWPDQRYRVELPIGCRKAEIKVTAASFCSHGKGLPEVSLTIDPQRRVSLVSVLMPVGAVIEGELRFQCSGPEIAAAAATPEVTPGAKDVGIAPLDRRFRAAEAQKVDDPLWRKIAQLCRDDPDECKKYTERLLGKPSCGRVVIHNPAIASIEPPTSEALTCGSGLPPSFDPRKLASIAPGAQINQPETTSAAQAKPLPEEEYCRERSKQNKTAAAICSTLRRAR